MDKINPKISVIVPCYNEEKNLRRGALDEVEKYLKKQKFTNEVIVSDDGSTDEGVSFIEKFIRNHPRFRLLKNEHAGKPFAIQSGVKMARGEIVLLADMDQSTPIVELNKLLPYFKQGYDIVIGSRGLSRKNAPLVRKIMARAFLSFRRLLLLPGIVDTQCGFKAFKRKAIIKIFDRLSIFKKATRARGWRVSAYDVEVLFLAQKLGLKIKEVIVDWADKDISESKKQNFLKESKEMMTEILRVKLNDFRGIYEKGN